MAALEADPQVQPLAAGREAVDAPIRLLGEFEHRHLIGVRAGAHRALSLRRALLKARKAVVWNRLPRRRVRDELAHARADTGVGVERTEPHAHAARGADLRSTAATRTTPQNHFSNPP